MLLKILEIQLYVVCVYGKLNIELNFENFFVTIVAHDIFGYLGVATENSGKSAVCGLRMQSIEY